MGLRLVAVTCFAVISDVANSTGTIVAFYELIACSSILAWERVAFVDSLVTYNTRTAKDYNKFDHK